MRRVLMVGWLVVLMFSASGCGDGGTAGIPDGSVKCLTTAQCNDGQYCNGAEVCDPDDPSADAFGCVPGTSPCGADEICSEGERSCSPPGCEVADADGDGYDSIACNGLDCDDTDPFRYPFNTERCTGVLGLLDGEEVAAADHDEDCDPCTVRTPGGVDGDADNDTFVSVECSNPWDEDTAPVGCDPLTTRIDDSAQTITGADCDDSRRDVRPNQVEICGDDIDNNCDGDADTGELFRDADNDGYGDPNMPMTGACMPGWVLNDLDCNDRDPSIFPGAIDKCDGFHNDCDLPEGGTADLSEDADGDFHSPVNSPCVGLGEVGGGGAFPEDDCNDDPSMGGATDYFNAAEICGDDRDNDCDTKIDEAMQTACADNDGDGYGDPGAMDTILTCEIPQGMVALAFCNDCDDGAADRYRGNVEYCDGFDSNCVYNLEDADGDRHAPSNADCIAFGESGSQNATRPLYRRDDCDDTNENRFTGATESCNFDEDLDCDGRFGADDSDCACNNGAIDNRCGTTTTVGLCEYGSRMCSNGRWGACSGATAPDDLPEVCNHLDDDCDGAVDDAPNCSASFAARFSSDYLTCGAGTSCFAATVGYARLASRSDRKSSVYTKSTLPPGHPDADPAHSAIHHATTYMRVDATIRIWTEGGDGAASGPSMAIGPAIARTVANEGGSLAQSNTSGVFGYIQSIGIRNHYGILYLFARDGDTNISLGSVGLSSSCGIRQSQDLTFDMQLTMDVAQGWANMRIRREGAASWCATASTTDRTALFESIFGGPRNKVPVQFGAFGSSGATPNGLVLSQLQDLYVLLRGASGADSVDGPCDRCDFY